MSLDVSLHRTYHISYDGGKTLEEKTECVFSANITHNLNKMADKAGIYDACWQPYEIGATKAKDIIDILEKGYVYLNREPVYFRQFNSANGWGLWKHFTPWVYEYLQACRQYPESEIRISS